MTKYFLLFALLFTSILAIDAQVSSPQVIVFKMMLFGDSAGRSTITRTHSKGNVDDYVLDSYIRAKILWIVRKNHTHYEAKYKDGILQSALYYEDNNDKRDKWSNISYDGKQYTVDSYKGKKAFTEAPTHSIGTIYCEPLDRRKTRIFYEPEADFNDLKSPNDSTAEFKSSDGNRNVYHFKNGMIDNAEFHTTLATLYLKRIK